MTEQTGPRLWTSNRSFEKEADQGRFIAATGLSIRRRECPWQDWNAVAYAILRLMVFGPFSYAASNRAYTETFKISLPFSSHSTPMPSNPNRLMIAATPLIWYPTGFLVSNER